MLGRREGWIPRFVCLWRGSKLIAAAPAYLKLHSQGEFVFDWAFADLAQRSGLQYYPKLLVAVPFTPAGGRRLLTAAGEDRPALLKELANVLMALEGELGVSSVHVNFARDDELAALAAAGMIERHGIQYHWQRRDAVSIDDYLARFNSKKRNQIKREIRSLGEEGISLSRVHGAGFDEPGILKTAFELYKSTVDKFHWGRQYLNPKFFQLLAKRYRDHLEMVVARDREGVIVGGAINIAGEKRLYGRYWGAREEHKFLHFNVCYYRGIEECVTRGLDVFEPGAGGEHKLVRGFEPAITKSAHHFAHPRLHEVLGAHIEREREAVAMERESMLESVAKKPVGP